jgi:hypothetical protein
MWYMDVKASSSALPRLAFLVQNVNRRWKKDLISSRWMYQKSKRRKRPILQNPRLEILDCSWAFANNTRAEEFLDRFQEQDRKRSRNRPILENLSPKDKLGSVYSDKNDMISPNSLAFTVHNAEVLRQAESNSRGFISEVSLVRLEDKARRITKRREIDESVINLAVSSCWLFNRQSRCGVEQKSKINTYTKWLAGLFEPGMIQVVDFPEQKSAGMIHSSCKAARESLAIVFLDRLKEQDRKSTSKRPDLNRVCSDRSSKIPIGDSTLSPKSREVLWQAWRNEGSQRITEVLDQIEGKKVHSESFDPGIGQTVGFIKRKTSSDLMTSENDCSKQLLRGRYCNLKLQQDLHVHTIRNKEFEGLLPRLLLVSPSPPIATSLCVGHRHKTSQLDDGKAGVST